MLNKASGWTRGFSRSHWRQNRLSLLLMLFVLWLLLLNPLPANAHALLIRSVPEANAELREPPASIELWFSEPLETSFSGARLVNALGQEVTAGPVSFDPADPTHISLPLGQLGPGVYTVAWQTLSQVDGHEWYGSFPLTILNPDGSRPGGTVATAAEPGQDRLPRPGEVVSRWLVLLGSILLFGAPLFQVLVAGQTLKEGTELVEKSSRDWVLRAIWLGGLAVMVGSGLQILLQAARLGGLGQLPELALSTRTGALVLIRLALALTSLLVGLSLPQPRPLSGREGPFFYLAAACTGLAVLALFNAAIQGERFLVPATLILAAVGITIAAWAPGRDQAKIERRSGYALLLIAGLLLFSLSVGSHAGAAPGSGWAILGDYIHLLAAAVWLGGLLLLPLLAWQLRQAGGVADRSHLPELARRFSRLAALSVFVLAVTGLFSSLVELPEFGALWNSAYGQVLLIKLGLVALTLLIAFFNHRLVRRRPELLEQADGLRFFNRQLFLETGFSLILLASVAVLVQTQPPPRPASQTSPQPAQIFNQVTNAGDLYLHTQVLPNQVGNNRFIVHAYHLDNSPIGEVQLVRLILDHPQLGRSQVDLASDGNDIFSVEGAYLSQAGPWDVSVYVRRRGMDDVLSDFKLEVPPPASQTSNTSAWQNPAPAVPAGWLVAGALLALGVVLFVGKLKMLA